MTEVTQADRLAADKLFDRLLTTFPKTDVHFRAVSEEMADHRRASTQADKLVEALEHAKRYVEQAWDFYGDPKTDLLRTEIEAALKEHQEASKP